jgi:type VI secretion system protein ImpE
MTPKQLFQQGLLAEAVQTLGAELRDKPTDVQRRTFLFELLCFTGEWDRAEKQLNVLAGSTKEAGAGAILYLSALHAARLREEKFVDSSKMEESHNPGRAGRLNGRGFSSIEDIHPALGPRLEVFAAGSYVWIPFEHIASIHMEAPRRLRDTLWAPAMVRTAPSFKEKELGEVLIPVLYPGSWRSANPDIRLGRVTEWIDDLPMGQKMLRLDDEEVSLLEVRDLQFTDLQSTSDARTAAA